VDRRVRVLLDLLLSLAESVPTRGSPLLPPCPQGALAPPQVKQPGRVLQLPPGDFGKCHSPWRILQIARAIAINYNLSTCYLIIVIILQEPLFLRETVKYIQ
jgi:putative transposase